MLKTSSTESAEPRKGVVGVGGGGRNKAESVGKHEVDAGDDGTITSMLRMSLSTDSSTRTTQIVAEYDGVDDSGRSGDFDVIFQVIRWRSGHCSFARKSQ